MSCSLETEPGLFFPKVMMGQRDLNIFDLYGQRVHTGAVDGPLFPTNGALFLLAAIGADATAGNGVTGSTPTNATTLSGSTALNATSFTVASGTGYSSGDYVQVDVNSGSTTAEVRKITNVATNTITVDSGLSFTHANSAAVAKVTAPFTHTITQANVLPSLTVEKNIGGVQSLQFAGVKVNKADLKVAVGNTEATMTLDCIAKSAAVLDSPNAVSVVDESPFVFAEATLTMYGQTIAQASTVSISVENGLKPTYTFNGTHDTEFITPVTRKVSGQVDVVFTSLDDPDWGYYTKMVNEGQAQLNLSLAHPSNGGSLQVTLSQVNLSKYADDLKMEDVVISSLGFEASLDLATTTTLSAQLVNSAYLPY